MYDYLIAVSSTCDLPRTYLDAHGIPCLSYTYTVDDEIFEDDCREESRQAIYKAMRTGKRLKTSMINEFNYCDFFTSLLSSGKDVIFLDMSQKMSVSYQKAGIGAEMALKQYPDRRLCVMDTRCISGGLGTLVDSMVERMNAGMTYDELIAWGDENKLRIAHRFTVDDLNYLKEGGRVSNASALVGSLLNVKPVLYVPDEGTLNVAKKVRGRKAALQSIIDGIVSDLSETQYTGEKIHILHADCREDAEAVKAAVTVALPGIGDITITSLGVVIGAHCGPGLLTVFYFCNGRRP